MASPEKATTATIHPQASHRATASARRIVTPVGNSASRPYRHAPILPRSAGDMGATGAPSADA